MINTYLTSPEKRILDLLIAVLTLVITLPVFIASGLLLMIADGFPLIYKRYVLAQHPVDKAFGTLVSFDAYKFRTMVRDSDGYLLSNEPLSTELRDNGKAAVDPRITQFGRILRRWSLDELPQLANVLRGQMSMVGPRIMVESESHVYGDDLPTILKTKPGVTGWWQVNARGDGDPTSRHTYDMEYLQRASLRFDLLVIFRTVGVVLSGRGAR